MTSVRPRRPDPISQLPENVIETILIHLPTRDVVKTSILAKKWRYRWVKLPQLILDETLWNKRSPKFSSRTIVTMITYQLLLHHEGPINKFILSGTTLETCPEIDNLVLFLLKNGIEDLTLELWVYPLYKLPSSFFTCQFRNLSLRHCLFESTPNFNGFSRLTVLKLCDVTISTNMLNSLISNSRLLELLDLQFSSHSRYNKLEIEIDAPNLKTFSFTGHAKSINFVITPLLSSISIVPEIGLIKNSLKQKGKQKLIEFFHFLPVLERLQIGHHFFTFLAVVYKVPRKLLSIPFLFKDIKLVKIGLDELKGLSLTLCLIKNSPNLKHVDIKFSTDKVSATNEVLEFLKEQDFSDVVLNKLQEVKLTNVLGTIPQLKLIEFLLSVSPNLMTMVVDNRKKLVTSAQGFKILRELTKYQYVSKNVEITYLDGNEDRICSIRHLV